MKSETFRFILTIIHIIKTLNMSKKSNLTEGNIRTNVKPVSNTTKPDIEPAPQIPQDKMEKLMVGTFGSEKEFKVLYILNKEAIVDKRVSKLLATFNVIFKDIFESDIKNKIYIYKLILQEYSKKVDDIGFDGHISSRMKNFFVNKVKNAKKANND